MPTLTFLTPPQWNIDLSGRTLPDICHVDIRRTLFTAQGLPVAAKANHRAVLTPQAGVWDFAPWPRDPETQKHMEFTGDALDQLRRSIARDRKHYARLPEGNGALAAPPQWRVSDSSGYLIPAGQHGPSVLMHTFATADDGTRYWGRRITAGIEMLADASWRFAGTHPPHPTTGEPIAPNFADLAAKLDEDVAAYGAQAHFLPPRVPDSFSIDGCLIVRVAHYVRDGVGFVRKVAEIETAAASADLSKLDMIPLRTRAQYSADLAAVAKGLTDGHQA